MPGRSAAEVERWYEAGREWEELLRREENEKWVKLQPGTVVGTLALRVSLRDCG